CPDNTPCGGPLPQNQTAGTTAAPPRCWPAPPTPPKPPPDPPDAPKPRTAAGRQCPGRASPHPPQWWQCAPHPPAATGSPSPPARRLPLPPTNEKPGFHLTQIQNCAAATGWQTNAAPNHTRRPGLRPSFAAPS